MAALSQTLCSLRNAQRAQKRYVPILFSKMTWSLLKILLVNGYIKGFFLQEKQIQVFLKQREEGRGLQKIQQISRPKQRVYTSYKKLPTLENGLGLLILSTPKGLCTGKQAQKHRVGGEILCQIF
jgi:small subunit ribosomal protein S8